MSYRTVLRERGFALPTVVVVSVILLTILTAAVGASSSIYSSLNSQYYDHLAREASESGVNLATSCLKKNNYVSQFTTNSLYPSNGCTGGTQCATAGCYIVFNSAVRSTFKVEPISASATEQIITSTGTVELLRKSDGTVWKTYKYVTRSAVSRKSSFSTVAFGYNHDPGSFFGAISPDGQAVGVGQNIYGQLGNGAYTNTLVATPIKMPAGVKVVGLYTNNFSIGYAFYALTSTGDVYAMGRNSNGQLGTGSVAAQSATPQKVNFPVAETIVDIEAGEYNAYFVAASGNVYATGACGLGGLGSNYTITGCTDSNTPVRVALPAVTADLNTQADKEIVNDGRATFLRMKGGRVYGWGDNTYGAFANGTTTASSVPVKIGTFGDAGQPKALTVSYGFTLYIVADNGLLYGSGSNLYFSLGQTPTGGNYTSVVQVDTSACQGSVKKAVTDQYFGAIVMSSGQLCMVGNNNIGQLGTGDTTSSVARRVTMPDGNVSVVDAAVCNTGINDLSSTLAIGTNGKVYGTGSNSFGQLGTGNTTNTTTFVPMTVIDGVNVSAKSVLCGQSTSVILTTSGRIYTVGNNNNGQLGDGTTTNSSTPKANSYTNMFNVYNY